MEGRKIIREGRPGEWDVRWSAPGPEGTMMEVSQGDLIERIMHPEHLGIMNAYGKRIRPPAPIKK